MKLNLQKSSAIILVVVSLVILGAIFAFAPVCDKLIELKSGNMTHMKCFYTGKTAVILSILLLIAAISSFFTKGSQWVIIAIGIFLIVLTFDSPVGIGLCKNTSMACHSTAIWIRGTGATSIICGILMCFSKTESNPKFNI